jgi:hypothetical protein
MPRSRTTWCRCVAGSWLPPARYWWPRGHFPTYDAATGGNSSATEAEARAAPGSGNVTAIEELEIRRVFAAGVRVADIVRRTGRGESVVYRLTRGMQRKRPPPPKGRHAARNDRILVLVEKGWSQARVAEEFGLSPSALRYVVRTHPRSCSCCDRSGRASHTSHASTGWNSLRRFG